MDSQKIIIVDYGVGNIGSIVNMMKKVGVEAVLSSSPDIILQAPKLILPGVGSFDYGMKSLLDSGLIPVLEKAVLENKTHLLGICLGMQLLVNASEEGELAGLGWIKGRCKRFDDQGGKLKVPHMGWNQVSPATSTSVWQGMQTPRFYFVHSYHVVCEDARAVAATASYGTDFAAAISKDNIHGVQFHPEKSHKFGMNLLKNFAELPC